MNKKEKTYYVCSGCGESFSKWLGKCLNCGEWDTITKMTKSVSSGYHEKQFKSDTGSLPTLLSAYEHEPIEILSTGFAEVDRVLGKGVVPGSLILIGGSPGIGKSTLALQILGKIAQKKIKALYICGEESIEQVFLRSKRLRMHTDSVSVFAETCIETILGVWEQDKPTVVVIDSIQTLYSSQVESTPGSVSQLRECTALLMRAAKSLHIAIIIIGHVTKDGAIAGPRLLEHMVDTVLYFEGDSNVQYRLIRTIKNRFGAASEIALFIMTDTGIQEVLQTAEFFLVNRSNVQTGTAVCSIREGSRILLIEIQALVNKTHFGIPQRVASGINQKKLALLIAVMERFMGVVLGDSDIFINIAGGLTITEPGIDVGIVCAMYSSFRNKPLKQHLACLGEIGLGGELRPVDSMFQRLKQLASLGFTHCIVPKPQKGNEWAEKKLNIQLIACEQVGFLQNILF